jgi:DNA polymerase-1
LTDAERRVVDAMFEKYRSGAFERPAKLSKRSVLESYEAWTASEKERKKAKVLASKRDNVWIVMDEETLGRLEAMLDDEPIVSLDTETTGLDPYNDRIVGIAGYFPANGIEFYVPYGHIDPSDKEAFVALGKERGFDVAIDRYRLPHQLAKERVLSFYAKCVAKRKHSWHNYDYDCHVSLNDGIEPDPPYWDTLKAQRVLFDHEPSYRLKDLHAKYISKDESIMFEDLFEDATIFDKPIELAGIYAAGDGRKTYDLMMWQKRYIDSVDGLATVWYKIEQPLLHVDAMTERNGIPVDLDRLAELKREFEPRIEAARAKVIEAFSLPSDFNFDSTPQMAHLVYDIAGADPTFPKRFKKPERSTAADVIDALCEDLPQLSPLLEYRQLEKLMGTYVEKIPQAIEPATGRLHFALKSDGTDTGRYSSSSYCAAKNSRTGDTAKGTNIQNIPSRTKEGVEVRKAFVPSPGYVFVSSDLSQIEPRVIAHILFAKFGDDSMKRIYDAGVDLYTTMAMKVFALDEQFCVDGAYDPTGTFKPRKLMKEGVLAYLYGQKPNAFARRMGVTADVATMFFESMTTQFPGLKPFKAWAYDLLVNGGGSMAYSQTLFGRKRRYPTYREDLAAFTSLESELLAYGQSLYRGGRVKGRNEDEEERNKAIRNRLIRGESTEDDRDEFIRIGINFRKKDERDEIKARYYDLRGKVNAVRRQAVNQVVQGTAADILKMIVIRLYWTWRERGWRFLFSAHDEAMTEVLIARALEAFDLISEIMTKTVELTIPLKCDTVVSPRWMDEYKRDAWDFENGRPKTKEDDSHVA